MKKKQAIGLLHLFLVSAAVYIASVFYGPFISAYYVSKGMTPTELGILLMIGPLAAIFIQPIWAGISDRSGKRKQVLLLVTLGSALAMLLYYVGHSFLEYLLIAICVAAFISSVGPLSNALIIEQAERQDLSFAMIRMGGTIGYALVAIWAGRFIGKHQEAQFLLSFAGYLLLALLITQIKEPEPLLQRVRQVEKDTKSKKGWIAIITSQDMGFVLIFAFLCQVGLSFYSSFLGPYILDKGFSESEIGIMSSISAFSEIPILLLIKRLEKKYGTISILGASGVFVGLRIFLPTGSGLAGVFVAQLLQGVTYMTIFYSCTLYIHHHVPEEQRSQGQSLLSVVQVGLGAMTGNLFGGWLVEGLGYRNSYRLMAVLIMSTTIIIILLYRRNTKRLQESLSDKKEEGRHAF